MRIVILFLLVSFCVRAHSVDAEDPQFFLTNKIVEIEWDLIPEAARYDLEVYDGKQKRFIKTFTSKSNIFKLNVRMGKYYFRSRIIDKFDRSSAWTEMAELLIAPPPTKIISKIPNPSVVYADRATGKYLLRLAWEPVAGVDKFKVLVETPEGVIEKDFVVKNEWALAKIPPGQYNFRVQAVLTDGTLGEPSEPTEMLTVIGAQIQPPTLVFKKDPKEGQLVTVRTEVAKAVFDGELFYKPLEGEAWAKVKDFKGWSGRKLIFDSGYKPGQYLLQMQASAKGLTASAVRELEFVVKPSEPVLVVVPTEVVNSVADQPAKASTVK